MITQKGIGILLSWSPFSSFSFEVVTYSWGMFFFFYFSRGSIPLLRTFLRKGIGVLLLFLQREQPMAGNDLTKGRLSFWMPLRTVRDTRNVTRKPCCRVQRCSLKARRSSNKLNAVRESKEGESMAMWHEAQQSRQNFWVAFQSTLTYPLHLR